MDELAMFKPRMRGRIHQAAFWLSIPAGISLLLLAQTAVARVAGVVYAVSLSGLYAASAAFHRISWSPRAWEWMRRLDHSMIYVLIAGTYTPFALLALPSPWSTVILWLVWTGAAAGIAIRIFLPRLTVVQHTLYLTLGWVAVITLPVAPPTIGYLGMGLLVAGGLFYTLGAIMFHLRRPDPVPAVFGYHEVWHTMVIAGSLCHYILILTLVA